MNLMPSPPRSDSAAAYEVMNLIVAFDPA